VGLTGGEPVWIAGSTHHGEETLVLDAFRELRVRHPSLTLILAPRDPGRIPEVERLLRERNLNGIRRSSLPGNPTGRDVIVLDTVGELAQLYALADVVFVGGSLVPWGGHNMLEPAFCRKPVVFGPYNMNFRESADLLLRSGGAIQVRDGQELLTTIRRLLETPELRERMGEAGFQAVSSRRGAAGQTLELIQRFLMNQPRDSGKEEREGW
jgi:3-deoxy-D-manno-octulosonic-acid transferase